MTRPVFLLGGVLLCGLGAALAVRDGEQFDLGRYILAQLLVTSVQLLAQYTNEWYDLEADRYNNKNRTWFSGGSGVLPSGHVDPGIVRLLITGLLALSVALALVAGLVVPAIIPITLVSILGAWFYSAPPLSLMSTGWGELSASLVVALLVPITGYTLQTGFLSGTLFWMCLPFVLIHIAMLLAFALPDRLTDTQVGKRTLVVRSGHQITALLHAALLSSGFIMLQIAWSAYPFVRWAWVLLPLVGYQITQVSGLSQTDSPHRFQRLTFSAVALFALTVSFCLIAVLMTR